MWGKPNDPMPYDVLWVLIDNDDVDFPYGDVLYVDSGVW